MKNLYLLVLTSLVLCVSCENEVKADVDIDKIKQEAVAEYIQNQEEERTKKLEVIEKFYGVFENGDMSVLPEILAENYTQYPSDPGQTPDIDGFVKHAEDFAAMFSELDQMSTHILVDGDLAFVRSDIEITHSGHAFNIPATNKRIKINAFDLHHFNAEGKIDKTWHLEDFFGAFSQIQAEQT